VSGPQSGRECLPGTLRSGAGIRRIAERARVSASAISVAPTEALLCGSSDIDSAIATALSAVASAAAVPIRGF
jgi:hypothetical protein